MLADNLSLDIFLHLLKVIAYRIDVFRYLHHILLAQVLFFHQKRIPHRPLSKRLFSNFDVRPYLTPLHQWFLPVNLHPQLLDYKPRVTHRVVCL
jgi:hypothetical protein